MQKKIVSFVKAFSLDRVSNEIKERAVRAFSDTIAVILAGARGDIIQCVAKALDIDLKTVASEKGPVILGYGHRSVGLTEAVLLNAVAAHSCEFNDLFYGLPGHPSSVLVPVVLGLGERLHKNGHEVLEAYVCGLEVLGRINEALMPEHHVKGFHSTSTAGIIGAAMAAGKLLGMDEKMLIDTCSMACTFACGLRGNFGYTGNSLHVGNAVANGLRAALYVNSGIRAREHLFDLPDGYFHAFGGNEKKMEEQLALLGEVSVLERPGLLIKKYPVCFSAYQAVEAARMLTERVLICPEDISKIQCLTSPVHYMSLPAEWPDNVYGQRFCVPFCVCWVLSGRKIREEVFSKPYYQEKNLLDLRKKITYSEDPEQQGEKGFGSTIVRVYLKKGKVWEYRAYPNPEERVEGWTEEQLKEKFNECCNVSGNPKEAERLWNICQSLEESDDITTWLEQWPERIKNEND